ncbi:glycosyltransferase [Williamsia phyllosphaerae]|uniref:Glycosyltransferase subfamily 4-like N-terminal domain-containing protein n=1 Tax=Williamsia phyllosphaerae TaxID=885042 RepID=A0ABQ1UW68_9NOCA|nr:glycosyltransferase [Williamsia phyllosphaerae]GGF28602.1 hypothetical protein GCM10007298_25520 [Williamsia phyllosphaerae]
MTSVTLVMSKDPVAERGGDVELSRLLITLAADDFDVSAICLSPESGVVTMDLASTGLELTRVRKPAVAPHRLAVQVLRSRRSLVHARFDTPDLRAAIDSTRSDVVVAEHSYMAESFLNSARRGSARLVVNTHVSESLVWRATRGILGRIEEPRLLRDELRVARAADAVGTFDADEAEFYRARGVHGARWLDLTLPPAEQVAVADTPPRLVFMGTRDWPPNQEAFEYALALWPAISAGIEDAELCVIGAKKTGVRDPVYPAGVRDLGFVDDLHGFLGTCRAMVAPIVTGGGVRVKILDAARIGLPVVGTSAAVGSLGETFGLSTHDSDEAFVAACRGFLTDASSAARAGADLYEINRDRWVRRAPHAAVAALLDGTQAPTR